MGINHASDGSEGSEGNERPPLRFEPRLENVDLEVNEPNVDINENSREGFKF